MIKMVNFAPFLCYIQGVNLRLSLVLGLGYYFLQILIMISIDVYSQVFHGKGQIVSSVLTNLAFRNKHNLP